MINISSSTSNLKYRSILYILCVSGFLIWSILNWSWLPGISLLAIWWGWLCFKRATVNIPPFLVSGGLFVGTCGVSTFLGIDPAVSWNSFCLLLSYLVLWIYLWNLPPSITKSPVPSFILSTSLIVYSYACSNEIFRWYRGWFRSANETYALQPELLRLWTVRNYPNEFGIYIAILIPIATFFLFQNNRSKISRHSVTIILILLWILMLYSRSRSAGIACCTGIFALTLTQNTAKSRILSLLMTVSPAIVLSLFDDFTTVNMLNSSGIIKQLQSTHSITPILLSIIPISFLGKYFSNHFRDLQLPKYLGSIIAILVMGSTLALGYALGSRASNTIQSFKQDIGNGRTHVWATAIQAFEEHPWLGIGRGCFGQFWTRNHESGTSWVAMHGHNISMDLLATNGIFGWTLFTFILALLLNRIFALRSSKEFPLFIAILMGMISTWYFDSPFTSPSNIALLLIFGAFLFLSTNFHSNKKVILGPLYLGLSLLPAVLFHHTVNLHQGLAYFDAAEEYSMVGKIDSALPLYLKSHASKPSNPLFSRHAGICLAQLGRLAESASLFRSSLEQESTNVPTWLNLGWVQLSKGDTNAAIVAFGEASRFSMTELGQLAHVWQARLKNNPDTNLWALTSESSRLFPAMPLCQEWISCRQWANHYMRYTPEWSGVFNAPKGDIPPNDVNLAYFWHRARNEPAQAQWCWNQSNQKLLLYLTGNGNRPVLATSQNSRILQAIETNRPTLLSQVEIELTPNLLDHIP